MNVQDLTDYFGSLAEAGRVLGYRSRGTILNWPNSEIPIAVQYRIQVLTMGQLTVDADELDRASKRMAGFITRKQFAKPKPVEPNQDDKESEND